MTELEILEQELKVATEKKKSILWEIFYIQERNKNLQQEKVGIEALINNITAKVEPLRPKA